MNAILLRPTEMPVELGEAALDSFRAAAAAERGDLCQFLSAIFHRPLDAEQIAALTAPGAADALGGIEPGAEREAGDSDPRALQHILAVDFTHVFHAAHDSVQPYEGIQTGQTDELMGPAAQAVGRFMAGVGFTVAPGQCPDHLSVELAFMAELSRREAEVLTVQDAMTADTTANIRRQFFAEHLGRWGRQVAREIGDRAESTFYCSMARLLCEILVDIGR
jgi:TorA maturation chaperone TorD